LFTCDIMLFLKLEYYFYTSFYSLGVSAAILHSGSGTNFEKWAMNGMSCHHRLFRNGS
jgi:hypothetical protein